MAQIERDILNATRAYPMAQQLLGGVPLRRLPSRLSIGWHGTETEALAGATAVVADGAGLDELFGEVLKVTVGTRSTFVYVLGARAVPAPLSLSRRAFLALGLLSHESLLAVVEVVA